MSDVVGTVIDMSDIRIVLIIAVLGIAMLISAVLGVRHRSGVVLLALLSLLWLLIDQDFEGHVLLSVTGKHGLTTADLVGVGGLVVAAGLWLKQRRKSAKRSTDGSAIDAAGRVNLFDPSTGQPPPR
jgi:hypothetical protein